MADLGQLWFSLGIKDNTQAGIERSYEALRQAKCRNLNWV